MFLLCRIRDGLQCRATACTLRRADRLGRSSTEGPRLRAAVLARMLGIHITVAAAWQRASAGDWTSYAADVSRRKDLARG